MNRNFQFGNFRPFKRTGNRRAIRELQDKRLVDLAIYRVVRCKARLCEIQAFFFNQNPTVPPPSDSQVHCAEKLLNLTSKRASTTSYKAYTPRNMMIREQYWGSNYPLGVADVASDDMLDLDEMGL